MMFAFVLIGFLAAADPAIEMKSVAAENDPSRPSGGTQPFFTLNNKPKYPPGFQSFSYVNLDPSIKGGTLRMGVYDDDFTTFVPCLVDTASAPGSRYMFDSLMAPAADDPYTVYPRLARNIEVGPGCDWVAFNLDPRARWNKPGQSGCEDSPSRPAESQDNRTPVTADDVAYSFQAIKSHCWQGAKGVLNGVTGVQTPSNQKVVFKLKPDSCRSSIFTLAKLPIFSKKFFSDPAHEFTSKKPENMGAVVGSGPYMVAAATKSVIAYKRVCDYWGRDLPASRGQYNFDRIQYLRFKDMDMLRAAFKIGEVDYLDDIPPQIKMSDDRKLKELADSGSISEHMVKYYGVESFEALTINTSKPALADRRVRQALALLYEPEFVSQNLRSGESHGVPTYFPGADTSAASDTEVQSVLKDLKAAYPNEVPEAALELQANPEKKSADFNTLFRARAQTANRLMREAGWALVDQDGEKVWKKGKETFPTLYFPAWNSGEFNLLVSRLNQFGIKVNLHDIRSNPLYRTILQKGQFDLMPRHIYHADLPNESLRSLWGVAAAEDPGHSYNFSRFKNKAVDDLVGRLIRSDSSHERAVLTRALDQVLLQESPVILTQQSNGVKTWVRGANLTPPLPLPANGESPLFNPNMESWWENKRQGKAKGR